MKLFYISFLFLAFLTTSKSAEIDINKMYKIADSIMNGLMHAFLDTAANLELAVKSTWNGTIVDLLPCVNEALHGIGNLAKIMELYVKRVKMLSESQSPNAAYIPSSTMQALLQTVQPIIVTLNQISNNSLSTVIRTNLENFKGTNGQIILPPQIAVNLLEALDNFVDEFIQLKVNVNLFTVALQQVANEMTDPIDSGPRLFIDSARTASLVRTKIGKIVNDITNLIQSMLKSIIELPNGNILLHSNKLNALAKIDFQSVGNEYNLIVDDIQLLDNEINSTGSL